MLIEQIAVPGTRSMLQSCGKSTARQEEVSAPRQNSHSDPKQTLPRLRRKGYKRSGDYQHFLYFHIHRRYYFIKGIYPFRSCPSAFRPQRHQAEGWYLYGAVHLLAALFPGAAQPQGRGLGIAPGQGDLAVLAASAIEAHDPALAVLAGLEAAHLHLVRRYGQAWHGRWFLAAGRRDQQGLAVAVAETGRLRQIIAAMRPQGEAERHRTFLVGAIIGAPVVVHRPHVECLRRLHRLAPHRRIGLGIEERGGDAAHLDERRVEGGPGDTVVLIRHFDPASDTEPVLAGAGYEVLVGAHPGEGNIYPYLATRHGEGEGDVDALLAGVVMVIVAGRMRGALLSTTLVSSTRSRPATRRTSRCRWRQPGASLSMARVAISGPCSFTVMVTWPLRLASAALLPMR